MLCTLVSCRLQHTNSCSYSIVSPEMCRLKFRFSLRRSAGPFTLSCVVVVVISIVAAGAPFLLFFLLPCFSCSFVVVLSPERLQLCRGLELFVASVSNYWLFTFLTSSFTTHFIQKIVQNIIYFYYGLFYSYKFFKNDLNLTMFAQIFQIRRAVKLGVEKVKRPLIGGVSKANGVFGLRIYSVNFSPLFVSIGRKRNRPNSTNAKNNYTGLVGGWASRSKVGRFCLKPYHHLGWKSSS